MPPRKKKQEATSLVEPISPKRVKQQEIEEPVIPTDLTSCSIDDISNLVNYSIHQKIPTRSSIEIMINLFSHLEIDSVRKIVMPFVKFDSWININEKFRENIFSNQPKLKSLFGKQIKNFDQNDLYSLRWYQAMYFSRLFDWTIEQLETSSDVTETIAKVLELIIVLLAQLPTRRSIRTLLEDKLLIPKISRFISNEYCEYIARYMHFPIDDFSAEPLDKNQVDAKIEQNFLDKIRTKLYDLGHKEMAFSLYGFDTEEKVAQFVDFIFNDSKLKEKILDEFLFLSPLTNRELVHSVLVDKLLTPKRIVRNIGTPMSRFPTESEFDNIVSAAPKHVLTTQYLSLPDYLDRNMSLYRTDVLEKVRSAFDDSVPRLDHKVSLNEKISVSGSSRMIAPVSSVEIITVRRDPFSGSPSGVKGEVVLELKNLLPNVRDEWDSLRNGDVLFLLSLGDSNPESNLWSERLGIELIRGCSVIELVDGEGNLVSSKSSSLGESVRIGDKRIARVDFDPLVHTSDVSSSVSLSKFQFVLRLRSTETVFKSVFSCSNIGSGGGHNQILPEWFLDFFLGYGSPESVIVPLEDAADQSDDATSICDRYGLVQIHAPPMTGKHGYIASLIEELVNRGEKILLVSKSNEALNLVLNKVRDEDKILKLGGSQEDGFSRTGRINHLLAKRLEMLGRVKTLAVAMGLPETVADDFSYDCDNARQFLETRVKPANDFYMKTIGAIDTREDREKWLTDKLLTNSGSSNIAGIELLNGYKEDGDRDKSGKELASLRANRLLENYDFEYIVNPFKRFRHESYEEILKIFSDLEKLSSFEILRTVRDRSEFLLTCFSRIICGTSTSVMMNRENLMEKSKVRFSTIIVDEANQMLDLETFLCLSPNRDSNDLKRVILVGDELQLGPVVSSEFSSSNFGVSLFSRLNKLEAPSMRLDQFVECQSPFISQLLRSTYGGSNEVMEISACPPGMVYDAQFIDVGPYLGQGEMEPSPNVYQNLGEAEYVVALYMMLRLNGVSEDSISILTAYTGQKNLIQDIVKAKCDWNPIFGKPRDITTIDQFQGQSNDIVLVSLVRTQNSGHMRDKKRWVTMIGTARQALYVFGRRSTFMETNDPYICMVLNQFSARPPTLSLRADESVTFEVHGVEYMLEMLQDKIREALRKSRI